MSGDELPPTVDDMLRATAAARLQRLIEHQQFMKQMFPQREVITRRARWQARLYRARRRLADWIAP